MPKPTKTKVTKKEKERRLLDAYLSMVPVDGAKIEEGEQPDFVLRGARSIGLEVTEFYIQDGANPASEQRQRERRDDVLAKAKVFYHSSGENRVGVTVGFDPANPIANRRRSDSLARGLADFVRQIGDDWNGAVPRFRYQQDWPEIGFLYIVPATACWSEWRVQQVYNVGLVDPRQLERIVRAKERKAKAYRPCDALWLLISINWLDPDQDQQIGVEPLKVPSAVFERIILFNTSGETVDVVVASKG